MSFEFGILKMLQFSSINQENMMGAISGSRLYLNFDLDFTDFAPKTVPMNFKVKMEEKV